MPRVSPSPATAAISRAGAAIVGGYAFASTAATLLALGLPLPPVDAVVTATLLSFVFYTGAALRAFAAPSARRAWAELLLPAALMALAARSLA